MPRGRTIQPTFRHARRALALLLLASAAAALRAAPAPLFATLLHQSLAEAPTLLEQAANVRAARGDARQARAWANPSIDVVAENLAAQQTADGATQRQTTYSVTQPFELWGKRSARIAYGDRSVDAAEARAQEVRIAFAATLATAYATAQAADERRRLAAEDLGRDKDDLRAARALVEAGKEASLRAVQAEASVAAAQAVVAGAEADAVEALERLSALVGADTPYDGIDTASLLADPAPVRPVIGPTIEETPAVIVARAEREALAARLRIEQKKPIPDIGLSAGMRSFGGLSDRALVVGVTATIPLFDRNAGAIAAAREREAAADQRLAATRLEADADRRSAQAQVAAAEGRLGAALQGEKAAAEAYRLGRIGYDAGKTALLELLTIRRALSDARLLTIDARLARVRAQAALAQADGRIAFGD